MAPIVWRRRAGRLAGVREWLVGGALVEAPTGVLLVRNVRRGGATDWSTPGGVIDDGVYLGCYGLVDTPLR